MDALIEALSDKVNLVLALWSVILLLLNLFGDHTNKPVKKTQHPPVPVYREFTRTELAQFDGIKSSDIYLGVDGRVYDVTRSRNFYGPDGPYAAFAGKDCTVMLAKQSLDVNDKTTLAQLKPSEKANLEDWKEQFQAKYTCVGELVPHQQ